MQNDRAFFGVRGNSFWACWGERCWRAHLLKGCRILEKRREGGPHDGGGGHLVGGEANECVAGCASSGGEEKMSTFGFRLLLPLPSDKLKVSTKTTTKKPAGLITKTPRGTCTSKQHTDDADGSPRDGRTTDDARRSSRRGGGGGGGGGVRCARGRCARRSTRSRGRLGDAIVNNMEKRGFGKRRSGRFPGVRARVHAVVRPRPQPRRRRRGG
jgi:hypothetical protein